MSSDPQGINDVFDLVLVGGGLQNGLIALKALHAHPNVRIALIERETRLGGNHTWCVHAGDLSESARVWIDPLIVKRYDGYEVSFPDVRRTLESPYAVISSDRFHELLMQRFEAARPRCELHLGSRVAAIEAQRA